jgi:citrate lyase beta subunit
MNRDAGGRARPAEPLLCRSMLMTCALHTHRYAKAAEVGADICTIDLEDSVPERSKEEARRLALPFFMDPGDRAPGAPLRAVRINSLRCPDGLRDILALLDSGARPDALFVPKVDSAQDLLILQDLLGERLASVFFLVLIETAAGLSAVEEIAAASPRVRAISFGGADFSAELGISMAWEHLLYARSRIVVAAARAGIAAMDSPYFELDNAEGLREETAKSRAMGFQGRVAVHTKQVPAINAGYAPEPKAVERARRIVAATEEHGGQIAVLDGDMIGPPMVMAARRMLALAAKISAKNAAA